MQKEYLESLNKISKLKNELEKVLANVSSSSFEDDEFYGTIEFLFSKLDNAEHGIKYLSKESVEGSLREESNGRFSFNGQELTCGTILEVLNEDEEQWIIGRVEARNGEYYFYDSRKNPNLYTGMKVRRRE